MTKDPYSRDGGQRLYVTFVEEPTRRLGSSRQLSREVCRNTTQRRDLWIGLSLAKEIAVLTRYKPPRKS
jgi:hypothetical protein